jgi:hypothetical protein
VPPAWAGQLQRPEQGAHHDGAGVFVSTRRGAVRAGRLRGEGVLDLRVHHRLLDSAAEVLGLGELQPQGVGGHGAAFQGEHLTDFGRLVLAVEHDLHGDLHATLRHPTHQPGEGLFRSRSPVVGHQG